MEQEKEEGLVREHRLKGEISMFEETIEAKDQLVRNLGLKVPTLFDMAECGIKVKKFLGNYPRGINTGQFC